MYGLNSHPNNGHYIKSAIYSGFLMECLLNALFWLIARISTFYKKNQNNSASIPSSFSLIPHTSSVSSFHHFGIAPDNYHNRTMGFRQFLLLSFHLVIPKRLYRLPLKVFRLHIMDKFPRYSSPFAAGVLFFWSLGN